MKYKNVRKGSFINRPNRFIANIEIDGKAEVCHVKNTGRMGELLIPGIPVWVEKSDNPNRKTGYDLISFVTEKGIINVDSNIPNKLFAESNPMGFDTIVSEQTYKDSRFDFYVEKDGNSGYCEIKGVTLLGEDGRAYFPDAPTKRGIKHINHLIELKKEGRLASICFIVKIPGITAFSPNPKDGEFCETIRKAASAGVEICAFGCEVSKDSICIKEKIEVIL